MSSRRTPTSIACAAVRDLTLLGALSLLAAGCGQSAKAPPPAPTAQVAVVTARSQPVPLTRDLVGRLSATRVADVRARVAGVLLKRLYKEGSDVQQGQVLFQIDPAPLQAALSGALAAPGPHFVLVKVTADEAEVPRIPYTPAALRDRFRAAAQEA